MHKTIKAEKELLKKIGRDEDFYSKLDDDIETYLSENKITDEDITFFMIGKSFFTKYGFNLNSNSYFPKSQNELDSVVVDILKWKNSSKKLKMIGEF